MGIRFAWILNLDADLELASTHDYAPRLRVLAAMQPHVDHVRRALLAPCDVDVECTDVGAECTEFVGRAFCLTPSAVARLRERGIEAEPHPSIDVLRRVNSRAFSAALGQTLPDGSFVVDEDAARAILRREPVVGRAWRVKRCFGMAGRGQRILSPGEGKPADLAFARAWFAEGGAQIEPHVAIERELGIHGKVCAEGVVRLGAIVTQRCDAAGAWIATERVVDIASDAEREHSVRIAEEGARVGVALWNAGYVGPFGVDAFTYRDHAGALCLQPRSEINARYSMGFAVGFGGA